MSKGPGQVQRQIIEALRGSVEERGRIETIDLTTTELAQAVLGRADREAIRQVRRAVDSLAKRGIVETGNYSPQSGRWIDDRPLARTYLRPTKVQGNVCAISAGNDECYWCAQGHEPDGSGFMDKGDKSKYVKLHMVCEVSAAKSRMRWVALKWEAYTVEERLFFLDHWIAENQATIDRWEIDIPPKPEDVPDDGGLEGWAAIMTAKSYWGSLDRIQRFTAERDELLS